MADNFQILDTEVADDPLARGYSGFTDLQVADDINANVRPGGALESMSAGQYYDIIDSTEQQALSADQISELEVMYGLGAVLDVTSGSRVETLTLNFFGGGTTSRNNFIAATTTTQFRWQEIGLTQIVLEGHVNQVRNP